MSGDPVRFDPERFLAEDAEKALLGAAILRPSLLGRLDVEPDDFALEPNRLVWRTMQELHLAGDGVDELLLWDRLNAKGWLATVGPSRLREAVLSVPTADNAAHYVGILRDRRLKRDLLDAMQAVAQEQATGVDAEQLLAFAQTRIAQLARGRKATAVDSTRAAYRELEAIQRDFDAGTTPGVPTGIPILDAKIGGLPIGIPTVLGARPGGGKSTLALHFGLSAAERDAPAHIVTYEDRISGFAQRLLARASGVDVSRIRSRAMSDYERREVMDTFSQAGHRRLLLEEVHGATVQQLSRRIRSARDEFGTKLVIVDYLQLMPAPHRGMKRYEAVSENAERLAELCGAEGLAMVIVSQLNRESAKEKRPPKLEDLRESGTIEQVGKLVLALHEPGAKNDPDALDIHILKNSQGPKACVRVIWDRARCVIR